MNSEIDELASQIFNSVSEAAKDFGGRRGWRLRRRIRIRRRRNVSQSNIPSSSGEAATDSGEDTPSSSSGEAAIEVSQPNISQPTKNSVGGFPVSEEQFHNQIIYEPMNYVGGFREGEINGKPFRIFTYFLSQTNNPSSSSSSSEAAIDSGGDDLPPPLFICPSSRLYHEWLFRREHDPNGDEDLPVEVSPQFFDKRSGDEQFQYMIGSEIHDNPCKLPLVPLFWCNNKKAHKDDEFCGVCLSSEFSTDYYLCVDACGYKFHKECIECPLDIKHPSFPFLSLKLYYPLYNRSFYSLTCFCCQLPIGQLIYYCPTKKITMHPFCAMKPIPTVIDHLKRHPHPLTFFPKQNFLPCDVCGLIKKLIPTYICARCVFVVHQDCIYHPYVIRISRHHHRISFTYCLPSGELSCGVCRRKVDNNYSAYSCNKCNDYFVHTKCALRKDLWDGTELEGVLEEPEIVVEPPFERISEGIIVHFTHSHHLKLEMTKFYDEGKFCQACILPIYEGNYYSCMDECDFILHEACANAPPRKHHPLHAHPLTLKAVTKEYGSKGCFYCFACGRLSCGFAYKDGKEIFSLDLCCASVSEPFKYEGHEHPLFLALTPEEEESAICQICQEEGDRVNDCKKLTCIDCKYIICFSCATLPYKAMYKHDKHLLTFRKKEEASVDHSGWCDKCEGKLVYSRKGGFYSCDDYCSTTLHVDCLLGGEDMYMKPGHMIWDKADILDNKTMTRPFCYGKEYRCPHKVIFKKILAVHDIMFLMENMTFCSSSCLVQFKE